MVSQPSQGPIPLLSAH